MPLRYTTLKNICALLGPRVKVGDGSADSFGQTVVPTSYILEQVGPQVEGRYDDMLQAHGVDSKEVGVLTCQSIVEKLIAGQVLMTYFVGDDVSDEGAGSALSRQGEKELKALWDPSTTAHRGGGNNLAKNPAWTGLVRRSVSRDDAAEDLKWT